MLLGGRTEADESLVLLLIELLASVNGCAKLDTIAQIAQLIDGRMSKKRVESVLYRLRRDGLIYEARNLCYAPIDSPLGDIAAYVIATYEFLREGRIRTAEKTLEIAIDKIKSALSWMYSEQEIEQRGKRMHFLIKAAEDGITIKPEDVLSKLKPEFRALLGM